MRPAAITTSKRMTNQASETGRPCCLKNASVGGHAAVPDFEPPAGDPEARENEPQQSRADGVGRR